MCYKGSAIPIHWQYLYIGILPRQPPYKARSQTLRTAQPTHLQTRYGLLAIAPTSQLKNCKASAVFLFGLCSIAAWPLQQRCQGLTVKQVFYLNEYIRPTPCLISRPSYARHCRERRCRQVHGPHPHILPASPDGLRYR